MKVNSSDFIVNKIDPEVIYYTIKGSETFLDDNSNPRINIDCEKVYAKAVKNKISKSMKVKDNIGYSYYIKSYPNKVLYNPLNKNLEKPRSFINKICKSELVFLEVTESVFNMYLNFLKTESSQWLNKAQREVK